MRPTDARARSTAVSALNVRILLSLVSAGRLHCKTAAPTMSPMGHKRKSSKRAQRVRLSPESGAKATFGNSNSIARWLSFLCERPCRANWRSAQQATHHRQGEKYRPQGHVEPQRSAHRRIPIGIGRERDSIGIDVGFCDHGFLPAVRGLTNRARAAVDL